MRCSARDSTGTLHVVYSNDYGSGPGQISDVYYLFSADNGLTWSETLNLSETGRPKSVFPALAIDRRGWLHCSWNEGEVDGQYVEIFYRCKDSLGWRPTERVTHTLTRDAPHFSSLACDSLNRVHLVWDQPVRGQVLNEIWYSIRDDSGWSVPENLTNDPWQDNAPVITNDGQDNFCLTWTKRAERDRGMCRFRRNGQWLPEHIIDTTWNTGGASTAADAQGRFHAMWGRGYMLPFDTLAIYYYAVYDTAWSRPVLVDESIHGGSVTGPGCMTADSAGRVYAAWPRRFPRPGGGTQWDILLRTFNGQEWSPIVNLTNDMVISYCPHLGYPVTSAGVDLFWTSQVPNTISRFDIMFMQLSRASSAVAEPDVGRLSGPDIRVRPRVAARTLHLDENEPAAVFALTGRRVHELQPGPNDIRHVPSGIYFVRLDGSGTSTKVVVQRR